MTHHILYDSTEICQTVSKLLNISPLEAREHLSLFAEMDPLIKNCLYYLSQIEDDDLKISAALGMEFLVKFKQPPFN